MVDSVQIFPPGWQMPINPGTQLPYDDGIIYFYEATTNTPLPVYQDAGLTTTLSAVVACDSSGFPVSSGNAKVMVYTGTAPYRVLITSATYGGTIFEQDSVKGALDASAFLTTAAVADRAVLSITTNYTVTAADKGKLLNVNCTAGSITITLQSATTLGAGFWVGIRHDGTANFVRIIGNGTDTFGFPGAIPTKFSLTGRGQVVYLVCDGAGFKMESELKPAIRHDFGTIRVASRLSAPPGSPNPGQRYILTAAPSGAWSTFAQNDIAEADGFGGWFKVTPTANNGWLAYVESEALSYQFRGSAWSAMLATDVLYGIARFATALETEARTSSLIASPAAMIYHPGVAKFVASVAYSGGTPVLVIADSYGVASVTDLGVGLILITPTLAFSSTNWACVPSVSSSIVPNVLNVTVETKLATSVQILATRLDSVPADPIWLAVLGFGDLA